MTLDLSAKNDYGIPRHIITAYTEGDCWHLAIELANRTGWKIVTSSLENDHTEWFHVAVMTPQGTILDIMGEWDEQDWVEFWGDFTGMGECSAYWDSTHFATLCRETWFQKRHYSTATKHWAEKVLASSAQVL